MWKMQWPLEVKNCKHHFKIPSTKMTNLSKTKNFSNLWNAELFYSNFSFKNAQPIFFMTTIADFIKIRSN